MYEGDVRLDRVHLLVAILLTWVTLGLYPAYWIYSRRGAFNAMGPRRVDDLLGIAPLGMAILSLVFAVLGRSADLATGVLDGLMSLVGGVIMIVVSFRFRENLRSWVRERERSPLAADSVAKSGLMTFLFGPLYLQYHINRLKDAGLL